MSAPCSAVPIGSALAQIWAASAFRGVFLGIMNKAFQEDKVIIEAQQRIIDRTADARIMPTAHDAGITIFNRIVQRMIDQQDKAAMAA